MAYEKEAYVEQPSAVPTQPQPQMREERTMDPYAFRKAKVATPAVEDPAKTGQPDKVVSAAVETTPKVEESVTLSPQMAALARKEQRIRQQESDFKKEKDAIAAERAELAEARAFRDALKAKDFSKIKDQVPYDEYTNYLIESATAKTPEMERLTKVETELEKVNAAHQKDVKDRFDSAVAERRKAVVALSDKPEFAKLKKAKGGVEAVVQHILDTWEHDNIDLDPETAAKEVQTLLIEKAKEWSGLLEEPVAAVTTEEPNKELPPLKTGIKTLTNNMAPTGDIKRPVKSFQGMSDNERYAEARRRAEEKLALQKR